ncbi:MAG: hypothetical protein CMJ18_02585 [Phycisphaeraceae bacterium]|nr:hypothetical protein [Phycisphaeraceae bacterium]
MKAQEVSHRFLDQEVLPRVSRFEAGLEQRVAAGMLGFGSDAFGLDDAISQDHHWGPRVNLILADEDSGKADALQRALRDQVPKEFEGLSVHHEDANRAGVTVEPVDRFFELVLGIAQPPKSLVGWVGLCEADLCHAVGGTLFVDPVGAFSQRLESFGYYPDKVWRKKIADWLILMTSHGPYNLARCIKRGDDVASTLYLGESVKRLMELGFMLNRRYAPYNKWLYRAFTTLPRLADDVAPLLNRSVTTSDWDDRLDALLTVLEIYMRDIYAQKLTKIDHLKPRDASIGLSESQYDFAVEMLEGLPDDLVWARFNEIERWETTVKEVVLDPSWKTGFAFDEEGD